MSIFRRNKQSEQRMAACPKCLQKVPADSLDCPVCGADLRELPARVANEPARFAGAALSQKGQSL